MSEGNESNGVLSRLLQSGRFSDLVVQCGSYNFQVHKAIVCERSEFFAGACKPDRFKEGAENVVTPKAITDSLGQDAVSIGSSQAENEFGADDPETFKLMIDFIYLHDYEAPAVSSQKIKRTASAATPTSSATGRRRSGSESRS